MPKIATAAIILLCLATTLGCWFIYGIEHRRDVRESREIEARDLAAGELEMYQAWHYATRYETFRSALSVHLGDEARAQTASNSEQSRERQGGRRLVRLNPNELWDAAVSVKAFQRSDVKFAGKSPKYGNASYQVSSIIIWRTHDFELRYVTAQSKLERMDGPGEWVASEWKFGSIIFSPDGSYHGGFPVEPVKRSE